MTVGWAITNIWYAALHGASGYLLARHGVRAATHADRDRWFRAGGFPEFTRFERADYTELKRASEEVRYEGQQFVWLQFTQLRSRAGQFVAKWSARAHVR